SGRGGAGGGGCAVVVPAGRAPARRRAPGAAGAGGDRRSAALLGGRRRGPGTDPLRRGAHPRRGGPAGRRVAGRCRPRRPPGAGGPPSAGDAVAAAGRTASDETTRRYATAGRADRLALLEAVRSSEPARGRDLLASTWARDPAADRAALVGLLAVSLSDDDEPFLEAALDDRSANVRQIAAELLARLPNSRRSARMAARLRPP